MNKQKNCFQFNQDLVPDWRDDEPRTKADVGPMALTANDIDNIDIDALYEEPPKGFRKSHIFLKKHKRVLNPKGHNQYSKD